MFKDSFLLFIKPLRTLDRLLFEENHRRSWGATWFLAGIDSALLLLLVLIYGIEKGMTSTGLGNQPAVAEIEQYTRWGIMIVVWFLFTALIIVSCIWERYLFSWFVRLGLRMVASKQYPKDPEDRRHKAKLLQLIQPYTAGIQTYPYVIMALLNLIVNRGSLSSYFGVSTTQHVTSRLIESSPFGMIVSVVNLGMIIYMVVTRIMAIQKIYGISGAKTFWGPFFFYFLYYMLIIGLIISIGVIAYVMTSHAANPISNSTNL